MTFSDQQYIDGAWTGAAGGGTWEVINPATEEIVRSVPFGGREDCHAAIEAAARGLPRGPAARRTSGAPSCSARPFACASRPTTWRG